MDDLFEEIEQAKQEWVNAQKRLAYLSEPELIDHGIFILEAAEKKYNYLLRKARELGVQKEWPYECGSGYLIES